MKKRMIKGIIFCGIFAQFAVLAGLIVEREIILKKGTLVLFATEPVDPYDAFRGRYLHVSLSALTQHLSEQRMDPDHDVYAHIQCDSNHVGSIHGLSLTRPVGDQPYIAMRVRWCSPERRAVTNAVAHTKHPRVEERETGRYRVHFSPVIDRFYVPEALASEADKLTFAGRSSERRVPSLACVRIYKGAVVLEDLQIEGRSICDVAREVVRKKGGH